MPKPELLDPQGKAITRALARNGFAVADVRQGKRFEITVDGSLTPAVKEQVEQIAGDILSNSVIEDVVSIDYLD